MEERTGAYRVEKPEGKKSLGSPGSRWKENVKINLQEMGCWYGLD